MSRWQISLRAILFLLIPAVSVVAVAIRAGRPRLVHTGDPFDLAIAGRGYFCVTGEFNENPRFTRGGKLVINDSNRLCFQIGDEIVWLRPMISIPGDYREFRLEGDGRVLAMSGGSDLTMGQLEIATFSAANLPVFNQPLFAATDETGAPLIQTPGEFGSGHIKQGYLEQRPLSWQRESMVTLLIGFALGALAATAVLFRTPPWRKNGTDDQEC